jgi:acetyl esterase/lipase
VVFVSFVFQRKIKKMNKQLSLLLLMFGLSSQYCFNQIPYNSRYLEPVFPEIEISENVVYGNAPALNFPYLNENNTSPQDLIMDIYRPVGDTLDYKPAIICAHSGAFVSGSKDVDDMVAFCDSMAHRGYVSASIDYRLGMNIFSSSSSTRAVYRGVQDGRAAIRFLKENADIYGIDTNNIYFLGSSAGGYIVQHNMFMDTEAERPPETYTTPDLGCLDCSGNSYNHSGKANGIMALWGALQDTSFIILSDSIPVFLAHGTADETVPFNYGSAFGNDAFPPTYGSGLVAERLENLGNPAETYFVFGAGHEFYGTDNGNWDGEPNEYWDTVFNKVEAFTYDIHKPIAGFSLTAIENVVMFEDTSEASTSWYWDFGDGYYSSEQNPVHEYASPGDYYPIQFVSNDLLSWDTASAYVVSWVGIEKNKALQFEVFPNPASKLIRIKNKSGDKMTLRLLDLNSKILVSETLGAKQIKIMDVSLLKPGLYILYDEISGKKISWIKQ